MKTVIITGSREYRNARIITKVMRALYTELGNYKFRHGKAKGADTLGAFIYTNVLGLKDINEYPAQWDVYGKAAGPIRNRLMLDTEIENEGNSSIIVIAFPLENSIGTYDMIEYAKECNVEVRIYDVNGTQLQTI